MNSQISSRILLPLVVICSVSAFGEAMPKYAVGDCIVAVSKSYSWNGKHAVVEAVSPIQGLGPEVRYVLHFVAYDSNSSIFDREIERHTDRAPAHKCNTNDNPEEMLALDLDVPIELSRSDFLRLVIGNYVAGFNEFDTEVLVYEGVVRINIYYDAKADNPELARSLQSRFERQVPLKLQRWDWAKGLNVEVNVYSEKRTSRLY